MNLLSERKFSDLPNAIPVFFAKNFTIKYLICVITNTVYLTNKSLTSVFPTKLT